jgi:hypothetical protein
MALTGAYALTKNQENMHIGAAPQWYSFEVTAGLGVDCTEDVPLLVLPKGSIIHDFVLSCVLGDTGATTVAGTLMLETLAVDLHTETADNMGATGVTEVYEIDNVENFPLAAADELRLLITTAGTSTTPGAKARVSVLVSRPVWTQ